MFCWDSIPIYFRINSFIYFVIWNIRTLLKNFCKSSCLVHANEVFFRYVICCSMECRKLSNFYRKNSLSVREPSPLSHTQNERTSKVVSYITRMISGFHKFCHTFKSKFCYLVHLAVRNQNNGKSQNLSHTKIGIKLLLSGNIMFLLL